MFYEAFTVVCLNRNSFEVPVYLTSI